MFVNLAIDMFFYISRFRQPDMTSSISGKQPDKFHCKRSCRFLKLTGCNLNTDFWETTNLKKQSFFDNFLPNFSRKIPIITIIGKKNVGKHSLVNRLTVSTGYNGKPGNSIRDDVYPKTFWYNYRYLIIDIDDFNFGYPEKQAALQQAALVIFVLDEQVDSKPEDIELAKFLKFHHIPVIFVVNKCKNFEQSKKSQLQLKLSGLGKFIQISAIHGVNIDDLLDSIASCVRTSSPLFFDSPPCIGIIETQNKKKPSLFTFLREKKRLSTKTPPYVFENFMYSFITGSINFNIYNFTSILSTKDKKKTENSLLKAEKIFKLVRESDCLLIIFDTVDAITDLDRKIAEKIDTQGKACIVLFDRSGLVSSKSQSEEITTQSVLNCLSPIDWAKILVIPQNTYTVYDKIIISVDSVMEQHSRRVSTSIINEIIQESVKKKAPPRNKHKKSGKIYYSTQVSQKPPCFAIFVNEPGLFGESYKCYIENQFRKGLGFVGTSLKIIWIKNKK